MIRVLEEMTHAEVRREVNQEKNMRLVLRNGSPFLDLLLRGR